MKAIYDKPKTEFPVGVKLYYLDCFHSISINGMKIPTNSYGPAPMAEVEKLKHGLTHYYDRVDVVEKSAAECPLPYDQWPDPADSD